MTMQNQNTWNNMHKNIRVLSISAEIMAEAVCALFAVVVYLIVSHMIII